jgi:hypothetical protein
VVAAKIQQVGLEVFQHGYVRAMHTTLIVPIAAAFVAAALCLLATRHTSGPQASGPPEQAMRPVVEPTPSDGRQRLR